MLSAYRPNPFLGLSPSEPGLMNSCEPSGNNSHGSSTLMSEMLVNDSASGNWGMLGWAA